MKSKLSIPVKIIFLVIMIQSCLTPNLVNEDHAILLPRLSSYAIFKGDPAALIPNDTYIKYELATTLFSDNAEKQRLIKVPQGSKMKAAGDLLPEFPDGTILVKTFFYYNDGRVPSKGKQIIETRIMIKSNTKWTLGTYKWNAAQTDATLMTTGLNEPITRIDESGNSKKITYHIPSNKECRTCHNSNKEIIPIGLKLRNLNRNVQRNGNPVNQLTYFYGKGIINPIDPSSITALPASQNVDYSVEQRTRAYLDVNCAHCHNPKGSCSQSGLTFSYETPFEETNIAYRKNRIISFFEKGRMPKIGTTTVDKAGLKLIRNYINELK